jgi:hypothetical protein
LSVARITGLAAGSGVVVLVRALAVLAGITALPASASAVGVREYRIPTSSSRPITLITGPDRALWFTELEAY